VGFVLFSYFISVFLELAIIIALSPELSILLLFQEKTIVAIIHNIGIINTVIILNIFFLFFCFSSIINFCIEKLPI